MSLDIDTLFELLPAHLRVQDALAGATRKAELNDQSTKPPEDFGPLRTLISIIGTEVARLEDSLDQLYDDHFIETCADWVAPYIGDLVGVRGAYDLGANGLSARALVANAIALRRAKGTAAAFEEVASAATLWNAVAVEFFQRVIIAQSMRLPRPARNATASVRDLTALRRIGSAFDIMPRAIEVRRISTAGGRWNLPNIGAFLRRTDARRRDWGAAAPVVANGRDFFFHPLGINTRLWAPKISDRSINGRRTIAHVPRPIDRSDMRAAIGDYWGVAVAIRVRARGAAADTALIVDPAHVLICDLPDAPIPPGFLHSPSPNATRVDPVRGRFVLADDVVVGVNDVVEVFFHEGAVLDFGGGSYERDAARMGNAIASTDAVVVDTDADVAAAITAAFAGTPGIVRIDSNALHVIPGGAVHLVDAARIAIGAENGASPVLRLQADLAFDCPGPAGAEIVLSGLTIAGTITVGDGISKLTLADVTLVPGRDRDRSGAATAPAAASLTIASRGCEVTITRSVLGPIVIDGDDVTLDLVESVVAAETASAMALAHGATVDGDDVSMQNVTLFGCVAVGSVGEISDSILWGRSTRTPPVAFEVERLQGGCVRFSALTPLAIAPRRYRCVPSALGDTDAPAFRTLTWPSPDFARLKAITPLSITRGASDGGEMGIYGVLKQRAREVNLSERLAEFTPFGMESGFFYEN